MHRLKRQQIQLLRVIIQQTNEAMTDFSTLYDQNIDRMFAFGMQFMSDRETLKDCIHDTFVKLFTRKDNLGEINNIENYLCIALRNRINDEYRRQEKLCDNPITDATMNDISEYDEFKREQMEREQTLTENITKHICKLSPRQQQIITLYYKEQQKYEDICRIMGISYQSVRNLMHRSIVRLREFAARTQVSF